MLIGESKLKIVATEDEMKEYKLEKYSSGDGSAGLRRSFWRVLDMAKGQVGFDPGGDKVLIQFYPMKPGGCEIFVTKLGILPEASARLVSRSNRISMISKNKSFYSFSCIEELTAALRAVKNASIDTAVTGDVYNLDGRYYLSIEEYGKGGEPIEFPCILEFGEGLTAIFGFYIMEHAEKLTDGDAVEKFSRL